MNITIFGASRGIGRAAVSAAAARGHTVTAVARSSPAAASGVRTIVGNVLDATVLGDALANTDAVVIALGAPPSDKSPGQHQVCSRATQAILAAMSEGRSRRIVVVSSYGVGPSRANRPFPFNIVAATLLKAVMSDKELQESEVRTSAFDWTIVQPLGLTDAPASGTPFVATDGSRRSSRVSRSDVAAVCIDAIESQRYVRETIAVSASCQKA